MVLFARLTVFTFRQHVRSHNKSPFFHGKHLQFDPQTEQFHVLSIQINTYYIENKSQYKSTSNVILLINVLMFFKNENPLKY